MNRLLLFLAGPISLPALAQNSTVTATLPVTEVTVYLAGAELQHSGEVSLPAGISEVRLTGLSPYLQPQSIQVEPGIGAELLSASVVPWTIETGVNNKGQTDTLASLLNEVDIINAEIISLGHVRQLLTQSDISHVPVTSWVQEMEKRADYMKSKLKEVALKQKQVEQGLRRAEERLVEYQRLHPGTTVKKERGNDVLVRLQVRKTGPCQLAVRYLSLGSKWEPRLDLRVPDVSKDMQLLAQSKAAVYNGSGLSWTNVKVELRTANPQAGATRPNLQPWVMNSGGGNFDEGRLDNFAVKGNSRGQETQPEEQEAGDLSIRVELPGRLSIKSGTDYLARLEEHKLPMRLEYLAVPKLDPDAFLVAKITEWEKLNLATEKATVYFRGAYIGETDLDTRAYNDTLEVSLGRDQQVVLSRTKVEDFSSKNLTGTTARLKVGYVINVKNTHRAPVRIKVVDQVPVPQDKELQVTAIDGGGAVQEPGTGRLIWMLTLAPGESKKLPFGFTLEYPKGKRPNLNRRRGTYAPKMR